MKVLAVEAHPDDVEILCAGTLARFAALGHSIEILSLTAGELGTMGDSTEASIRTRLKEAHDSAAVIGARFHYAGIQDKHVFFNEENRNRVAEIFRRLAPDVILAPSPRDYILDHEFTSLLARDAATAASARNFRTDLWDAAPATDRIPHLYDCDPIGRIDIFGRPVVSTTYVDIGATLETKIRMFNCFATQVEFLRSRHGLDYNKVIPELAAEAGKAVGVASAEGFRQHVAPPFPKNNLLAELLDARVMQDA